MVRAALELEGIDEKGLDEQDRQFLRTLIETYDGGPCGIDAIAATMGEERDTLEDVIEPYLMQIGLLARTARGRQLTPTAWRHLGLTPPAEAEATAAGASVQPGLFDG
jgi:Holliday junction DNA helicase RuvB